MSFIETLAGLMLAHKLGAGIFTGISTTGFIVVSIMLDHVGLLGFKQHTASPLRMMGGALMMVGVWMVFRF